MLSGRCLFLLLLFATAPLCAETSLENARRAQALLGPEIWSRLISVRNDTPGGPYPKTVHAVVFELAGILWFYCDVNGTQSFSLYPARLEQEKVDFGPLLREIEAGFGHWTVEEKQSVIPPAVRRPLRNGCFVESVVALRERLARGLRTEEPRLLSYYSNTADGRIGHTVLACVTGDFVEIFDPGRPRKHFAFPKKVAADPLVLARALDGRAIDAARYLALFGHERKAA